MPTNVGWF